MNAIARAPGASAYEARALRRHVLRMAYAGSSVHIACAFSIVEILAVLYRAHLDGNRLVLRDDKRAGVPLGAAARHPDGRAPRGRDHGAMDLGASARSGGAFERRPAIFLRLDEVKISVREHAGRGLEPLPAVRAAVDHDARAQSAAVQQPQRVFHRIESIARPPVDDETGTTERRPTGVFPSHRG